MKTNIIIPYRPLSESGMQSPIGPIYQTKDGKWYTENKEFSDPKYGIRYKVDEDEIIRTIKFLNKNSFYRHNIILVIDNDVYPCDSYLKEFDNVKIIKSRYKHDGPRSTLAIFRRNAADIEAINSIPDDEWICHAYQSDILCAKDWDKYIIEAIEKYGDNYVYVPMFVEIRDGVANRSISGLQPTPNRIWDEWRNSICCHALSMPYPIKEGTERFFTEEDMINYVEIANKKEIGNIIERPGDRVYGYYNVIFLKAKIAKKIIRLIGIGFDIDFDNRLYSECNLMKVVVTKSFVFHPIYCKFLKQKVKQEENIV